MIQREGGRKAEEKKGKQGDEGCRRVAPRRGAVFVFLANAGGMYPPHSVSVNQTYRKKETDRQTETESDSGGQRGKVSLAGP